jgi:nitrogen fixation/metabolism regulation signal transduction histidine kinase
MTSKLKFWVKTTRSTSVQNKLGWLMGLGLSLMLGLGLVLFFLLMQATNNQAMYEDYYGSLFVLNIVVASLLVLAIAWLGYRLQQRFKQGKFGSRLLLKLAAVFALAGFMPGLLIYAVSYQFVSRSIESWFDVKVEGALEAGLNLGRATLENLSADLANKTRAASQQIQDTSELSAALALERIREQMAAREVMLWSSSGNLLARAGTPQVQFAPQRPSPQQFRAAKSQSVTWVEGLDEALDAQHAVVIKSLVMVPVSSLRMTEDTRFLMVTQGVSANLVSNASLVNDAYREYQERALARSGLQRMYIGTLTLSLFLAVFGAVLLAAVLGNQITRPLLLLADGVRQVAAGDLTPKMVVEDRDELGGLTRSFADMTQQLADARATVQISMQEVNTSKTRLQTILDNLTAGVMVLSPQGEIRSVNPGASKILRMPMSTYVGQNLMSVEGLEAWALRVHEQFEEFSASHVGDGPDYWQSTYELGEQHAMAGNSPKHSMSLVARGALLPDQDLLLVFDDISEIVSAQRTQAWGEVARRLAHEIKNPLTPIQLSAERLEKKLSGKLEDPEQLVLAKSVKTIVDQVDAMKRLVNEFRDYGRLPAAELKPLNLNDLVREVLQLYGGEDTTAAGIRFELDPACPPIQGDQQQLRQVLHNLLQNAQDATALAHSSAEPTLVSVHTQWLQDRQRVRLTVADGGSGFPEHILKRAFEPYVTTKSKGTGLGLAVVKKITDDHGARIEISNREINGQIVGAQVSLSFASSLLAIT